MRSSIAPARRIQAQVRGTSPALLQLLMAAALIVSIVIAATAVSIGAASAQSVRAMTQPDTSLVLMLMLLAIGVMGVLSALAVKLASRSRPQSE
jgi:divalent metal cation (Fe/Co/Zn/Cd) transporter